MLWIFSLFSQLFLGFQIASIANPNDGNFLFVFALSVPFGFSISTFFYLFCSPFFGQNLLNLLINIIANISLSIFIYIFRKKTKKRPISIKIKDLIFPLIHFLLISIFLYICYSNRSELVNSVISTYLHEEYSLIASFTKGCNSGHLNPFSLRHPDHFKTKLNGKWLPALHSSMMIQGKASLKAAIFFPSLLMILSFCLLQQYFCRKLRINEIIIYFIPFLSFSIYGISCIDLRSFHMKSLIQIYYITQNPREHLLNDNNLIAMLAGTRSVIYAATISVAFVSSLFNKKNMKMQIIVSFFAGIILPSTVSSAFYGILLFLLFYFIQDAKHFPKHVVGPLFVGSLLNLHRIIIPFYIKPQYYDAYQIGTMFPPLTYWYTLTGLFFPIAFISYFMLMNNEKKIISSIFLSFIILSNLSFNKENCANLPLYYSFFIPLLTPFFFTTLAKIYKKLPYEEMKGFFIAFCCFLIFIHCNLVITFPFSKINDSETKEKSSKSLYTQDQIDMGNWIISNTNKTDIFITIPSVYDPVATIAGRIVYNQDYNVSLHLGFNITQRQMKVELLKDNPCESLIIPEIKYFVVKNIEKQLHESQIKLEEKKKKIRINELFMRREEKIRKEKILNEGKNQTDEDFSYHEKLINNKKIDYGAFIETPEEMKITNEELGIKNILWSTEEETIANYKRELLNDCAWTKVYSNDDYIIYKRHKISIF